MKKVDDSGLVSLGSICPLGVAVYQQSALQRLTMTIRTCRELWKNVMSKEEYMLKREEHISPAARYRHGPSVRSIRQDARHPPAELQQQPSVRRAADQREQ